MPDQANSPPLIQFENVTKSFGDRRVLNALSLEIDSGERVTLIGPSGSGKTTILRMLMTLERPDTGSIRISGEELWKPVGSGHKLDLQHTRQVRKQIGMVFQQFNLFPNMSVLENLTLAPTTVLGISQTKAEARAKELLHRVGMADKVNAHPMTLSGGQQQRVAIARALAMDPKILLLDEVTSALDPELVGEVLNVLKEVAEHTSITMLIVTHELAFARNVSDRVLMFDNGQVIESGPPRQVFDSPQKERTRSFVASVLSH